MAEEKVADNALVFRAAISNIFKSIAESVSEEEFLECLDFLKSKPTVIHKLHEAMTKDLCDSMNAELEIILAETNLSDGLGTVRRLLQETPSSPDTVAWRPPGQVLQHMRTPDAKKIISECERLQKHVDELESENNLLMEQVKATRTAVERTEAMVNHATKSASVSLTQMNKSAASMEKYLEIPNQE